MPNLKDERADLKAKAGAILDGAKAMSRELTDEETAKVESIFEDIKSLDEQIEKATKSDDLFKRFEALLMTRRLLWSSRAATSLRRPLVSTSSSTRASA